MIRTILVVTSLVTLLAVPAMAWVGDRENNPFGVFDSNLDFEWPYRGASYPNVDLVVAGGAGTVRQIAMESAWWGGSAGGVERTFGVYTFDDIDAAVRTAESRGVNVFLMIKTGGGSQVQSDWVDYDTPCDTCEGINPGVQTSYPPRDIPDPPMDGYQHFYNFVYAVVDHFDGSNGVPEIRYYEFQSEADAPYFFYGSWEQYWGGEETVEIERAEGLGNDLLPRGLMPVFARAVRDGNPDALIVAGSYTDTAMVNYQYGIARERMMEFGDRMYANTGYWDILGVHAWNGYEIPLVNYYFETYTQWFFDKLVDLGLDREVWFTELGLLACGSQTVLAETMVKNITTALHKGADRLLFFPNRGQPTGIGPAIYHLYTGEGESTHLDQEMTETWRFLTRAFQDKTAYAAPAQVDVGSVRLLPFDFNGSMLAAAWCETDCGDGQVVDLAALFGLAGGDFVVFDYLGGNPQFPAAPEVTVTAHPILLAWGIDTDGDQFPDPADTCPGESDPDQLDTDGDGVGDLCDNCERINTWQADADGDGYADRCDCEGFESEAAVYPGSDADADGYTACDDDCDDTDPEVNIGAEEVPDNGIDDNCNGQVDEVPPCFVGAAVS